jgi:RNA polymerase sigma-70 factor (ECF subfamily)
MTVNMQSSGEGDESKRMAVDSEATIARSSVGTNVMAYRDWSDLDLVASLAEECGDGYAELYRRHSLSVTATARMLLGNDSRCEDVVADVFVSLWLHPEKFDPARGSLLAFLRLKARGRTIDMIRNESARRRREATVIDLNPAWDEDVDSALIASDGAVAVRKALRLLPPIERDPIYLAFFSGLSYTAVAAELNLPEGTVKSRIRAGLSRLQSSSGLSLVGDASPVRTEAKNPSVA